MFWRVIATLQGPCECAAAGFGHDLRGGGFAQLLERGLVAFAGALVEFADVRVCVAGAGGDVLVWPAEQGAVDEDFALVGREPGQGGKLVECAEHRPPNAKRPPVGRPVGAFLPLKTLAPGSTACAAFRCFWASYCQFIRRPAGL
jgi:hypothetical protein